MATIAKALAAGPDVLLAGPRSRVRTGPGGASSNQYCLDLGAMRGILLFSIFQCHSSSYVEPSYVTRLTTLFFFFGEGEGPGRQKVVLSLHVPAIDNRVEIYYQELDLDKVTHIDTCTLPSSPPPSCWFQLWSLLFKNSLRRAERADKKSDSSPSPSKFPSSSDRGWYG